MVFLYPTVFNIFLLTNIKTSTSSFQRNKKWIRSIQDKCSIGKAPSVKKGTVAILNNPELTPVADIRKIIKLLLSSIPIL